MDFDIKSFDWNEYYKNKSNQTPRDTLVKVLDLFQNESEDNSELFAIDIGCGHGSDTLELLKNGWKVYATDNDKNGIAILEKSISSDLKKNLRTKRMAFENIVLEKCDLLNASYCLPFCMPEHFKEMWDKITGSIVKGGRFSGQLFGENDSWANIKEMTFHKKEEVKKMFSDFKIEYFDEKDEDGTTSSGESKHWHVYSVVAKKLL